MGPNVFELEFIFHVEYIIKLRTSLSKNQICNKQLRNAVTLSRVPNNKLEAGFLTYLFFFQTFPTIIFVSGCSIEKSIDISYVLKIYSNGHCPRFTLDSLSRNMKYSIHS